ncbi:MULTISPECIES: FAD-dependent oxidoreductase [unclassified Haloferax]|uniref:FAD-dependent oxidoreductase n=1 Tax=unclassified Haloferax TaxID=2625095 RepID=UPI002875C6E7|nr:MULTISPECIES: FAD-dependent oxidoreductase [unclassified Haloferax]MDS0242384.1 FAD-dependent oxidoreductase [Haloferax sp. S2CR25]MDS0445505.1 FAD-dependent oxidoreductase [Haloferax sp. S2CR25-2]
MDELARRTPSDGVAEVVSVDDIEWDIDTDVLVAGGGGTGLVAALAASENPDVRVTVLEKAPECGGNTSLSTGMVPAAGTRLQREAGIEETPADMARDILEKNDYEADEERVRYLCEESANLIHWLVDDWDVTLHIVDDFKYPKHSEYRMHAPEGRNGENLVAELVERVESTPNIELLTNAPVKRLVADDGAVRGVVAGLGHDEAIEAERVILATDGFAGNRGMVTDYCEEDVERALYFGADGNTGDGVRFGAELGGELACMDAYQGHATVASQTGVLSTYAVTMNGGILVNRDGERFGDESAGYSEFAISVLKQPGEQAIQLFDERIFEKLRGQFEDFDEAIERGTYHTADSVAALAERLGADGERAAETVTDYNEAAAAGEPDEVGRVDGATPLEAPFYGTKVTGALFHTQGGLVVDEHGRVLRTDGSTVENLYAGGGTACGISGHGAGGYLSGNGLTTALGYGRLAGIHARESLD